VKSEKSTILSTPESEKFHQKPCRPARRTYNVLWQAGKTMLSPIESHQQMSFNSTFEEQLNHKHPLYVLAKKIHWQIFEEAFAKHYRKDFGRPAKPIRLMVTLLILKHIRNLSDESVVEQWSENAYYQYFSGKESFLAALPCEASELVHFRHRIGEEGIELILKESIRVNGKEGEEDRGTTDTTVQEKNITYPTDNKLHRKIIAKCVAIAEEENLALRQSYRQTLKKLSIQQRLRNSVKGKKASRKADRKVKTIAGRLVRELGRKLPSGKYTTTLLLFSKVLSQKREDKNKTYSLHEPHVQCMSKGKAHKKYEFGSKVSITTTAKSGVIIGALNIPKNDYDGHTLDAALEQQQRLTGKTLKEVFVDRGYKGVTEVRGTTIHSPKPFPKTTTHTQKRKLKDGFARRAAIEPRIGHLKSDHRLSRNFYKGLVGDDINVMLAAAAMNFKRMMNIWRYFLSWLWKWLTSQAYPDFVY
jgi:IS5 family transposase